ncbi:restriction endonuclease [Duganella sp. LjRoot269]|uniref:restriction endonuclease n=1 Tax=Duganella sp. LjRoot269 TaxID=3342305 RepID=UPI003ECDB812
MTIHQLPIPAPTQSHDFEYVCLALFRRYWNDDTAQLYGVPGQKQSGIDIVGRPGGGTELHAVQCKVRAGPTRRLTYAEVLDEVVKADQMPTPLHHLIVATTARRDANLQGQVLALTQKRVAERKFPVTIMGWDDLSALLAEHKDIAQHYFPDFFIDDRLVAQASPESKGYASSNQRSARLRRLLSMLNDDSGSEELTISEIAEQLGLEKISHLEDYFSGADEPPIAVLKQMADLFCINLEWLLHGKGQPFYHSDPFFPEAYEAIELIRSTNPERIFFVRSSSDHGECLIVLQYGDWRYLHLNTFCHVSAHVGGEGRAQLLSLFNLIEELWGANPRFHCIGQTLEPAEFDKLLDGEYFPGSILGKPRSGSPWWDALRDIDYKNSTKSKYQDWYGTALIDAHRIIREQKAKMAARV